MCPGTTSITAVALAKVNDVLRGLSARLPNFHYLDNTSRVVGGQRFIGGTMWFPQERDTRFRRNMNDFAMISDWQSIYIEKGGS